MLPNDSIPIGLCQCGCGKPTKTADHDWPEYGHVKGQPLRYLVGHNRRTTPYPETPYVVDPVTQCWNWQLGLDKDGYGRLWRDGKNHRAHRVYFEERFGPLPEGMVPDHCCPHGPNRACVNPDHMEAATFSDNSRRKRTNKLTWREVATIRLLALQGELSQRQIGERFGVGQAQINRIIKGERWAS